MDIGRTLPADLSAGLFEATTRAVSDGVIQLDDTGRIVSFNASAERILGRSAAGTIGSDFSGLLYKAGAPVPQQGCMRLVLRDGNGGAVRVTARCEEMEHGRVVAFSPEQRLEEIEQLKTELVSTVSHELKTPLAAIKAYTATLRQNPALYETHRDEFLGVVEQQADRLSRLIDDMLLVSRVEAAQLLRQRVVMPVDGILDDAVREGGANPSSHPIERDTAGVRISGDPERLSDIFRNVIENAVKYSPAGGTIRITAREENAQTVIEIADCGIGIAEEHLPYIFDRFYRVEAHDAGEISGSGLGLYIVNSLVRAHGGSIDVRSAPGTGTTFTLRFPLR